ncbi:MAG: hypothetical protein PHW64_01195 [Sulfuricurvum sp.]|nr:hypothetical protein [Sulfuricurvum sp.]
MKKRFLLLAPFTLFANQLPYFVSDKHGYLPPNNLSLGITLLNMNDQIDLLNIKENEFSGTLSETAIGDMQGGEIFSRYRFNNDWMVAGRFQQSTISYGAGELTNYQSELYARKNIGSKTFALDVGMVHNEGDDIVTRDINQINSVVSRFIGTGGKFEGSNGAYDIVYNTSQAQLRTSATITPFISSQNLEDNTLYLRAIKSFVAGNESIDTYLSWNYTAIKTLVDSSIHYESDATLQSELTKRGITPYKNLDRSEQKIAIGVNYSAFVGKFSLDAGYEYNYFIRDSGLDYINHNHKIELSIGYKATQNLNVFIGGKAMSNQFNGEIPYLYNQYTQTSFDHKYGWAKMGIIYNF